MREKIYDRNIQFRITPSMVRKLNELSKAKKKPRSDIIRLAIDQMIRRKLE